MTDNLADRYNEGIVPAPTLSADIPRLKPPRSRPTPEQIAAAQRQSGLAIIILVVLFLFLLLICVALFFGLVP